MQKQHIEDAVKEEMDNLIELFNKELNNNIHFIVIDYMRRNNLNTNYFAHSFVHQLIHNLAYETALKELKKYIEYTLVNN